MCSIHFVNRFFGACLAGLLMLALAGCGSSGPKIVSISGTVTRGGNPVKDLTINFVPEGGRPSWATTAADGSYTLHYTRDQDGACVGKHKVWVVYDPPPADPAAEMARMDGHFDMPPDIKAIVTKYSEGSSPLEFDIQESQTIDLKLD